MSAQDAELAADAGGEFSDVGCGFVEVGGVEQAAQVAVAKACGGEFATGDGLEQGDVVGIADPQCSHAAVVVGDGLGDVVEYLMQGVVSSTVASASR